MLDEGGVWVSFGRAWRFGHVCRYVQDHDTYAYSGLADGAFCGIAEEEGGAVLLVIWYLCLFCAFPDAL